MATAKKSCAVLRHSGYSKEALDDLEDQYQELCKEVYAEVSEIYELIKTVSEHTFHPGYDLCQYTWSDIAKALRDD